MTPKNLYQAIHNQTPTNNNNSSSCNYTNNSSFINNKNILIQLNNDLSPTAKPPLPLQQQQAQKFRDPSSQIQGGKQAAPENTYQYYTQQQ